MKIHYSSTGELSEEAQKLVDFDIESIQLVVAAQRSSEPDVWIVAPEGYQAKGHLLRDSDSIRLMAYSNRSDIIYATDGCNSCRHILETALEATDENGLATLAERAQLPLSMLRRLAELITKDNSSELPPHSPHHTVS